MDKAWRFLSKKRFELPAVPWDRWRGLGRACCCRHGRGGRKRSNGVKAFVAREVGIVDGRGRRGGFGRRQQLLERPVSREKSFGCAAPTATRRVRVRVQTTSRRPDTATRAEAVPVWIPLVVAVLAQRVRWKGYVGLRNRTSGQRDTSIVRVLRNDYAQAPNGLLNCRPSPPPPLARLLPLKKKARWIVRGQGGCTNVQNRGVEHLAQTRSVSVRGRAAWRKPCLCHSLSKFEQNVWHRCPSTLLVARTGFAVWRKFWLVGRVDRWPFGRSAVGHPDEKKIDCETGTRSPKRREQPLDALFSAPGASCPWDTPAMFS